MIEKSFLALFLCALPVPAADYKFVGDAEHSVTLDIEKTGLLSGKHHLLRFPQFDGHIQFDSSRPSGTRVSLVLKAADIRCEDTWVSESDRKKIEDYARTTMLDAARSPEIRFESTSVQVVGPERFRVVGNLLIRSISVPVTLDVLVSQQAGRLNIRGQSLFKMTAFGMKPPSAALGAIGTRDEVKLQFRVEAKESAEYSAGSR